MVFNVLNLVSKIDSNYRINNSECGKNNLNYTKHIKQCQQTPTLAILAAHPEGHRSIGLKKVQTAAKSLMQLAIETPKTLSTQDVYL